METPTHIPAWEDTDLAICVGPLPEDLIAPIFGQCEVRFLPSNSTMLDVLMLAGTFTSRSNARKNWQGSLELPRGSHLFTLGKKTRKVVFVHNTVCDAAGVAL